MVNRFTKPFKNLFANIIQITELTFQPLKKLPGSFSEAVYRNFVGSVKIRYGLHNAFFPQKKNKNLAE